MPHKGFISVGSAVEVKFSADFSNNGTSALLTGYVPDPSAPDPPPPQVATVAPGGSAIQRFSPVALAFQLRITIDVPDSKGSGLLEVTQDGAPLDRAAIQADTIWAYTIL